MVLEKELGRLESTSTMVSILNLGCLQQGLAYKIC